MKCRHCGATRSMSRPGLSSATCEHCHARPIAAATTTGEGSGLIDIRAMAAALGASPMRPPTPLPGFRGLAPAAPPAPTRRLTVRPSQTPLHALLGVLVFGMVGLAGAVQQVEDRVPPREVRRVAVGGRRIDEEPPILLQRRRPDRIGDANGDRPGRRLWLECRRRDEQQEDRTRNASHGRLYRERDRRQYVRVSGLSTAGRQCGA